MSDKAITIVTNTIVKVIVTDSLRFQTFQALATKEKEIDEKLAQVSFQKQFYTQKFENEPEQLQAVFQNLVKIENDLGSQKHQTQERLQQVEIWKNGQEVIQTQVQSLTDIKIGSEFTKAMSKEIIVKDGVVVEIRDFGGN